jgi:ribosome-associated toxin RatA of RatAB toxin-antitoxin module
MTEISRSAVVPYSPAQLFAVVRDVRAYPDFLPWCAAAKLISETATEMVATLEIRKGGISQRMTTRNGLSPPSVMTIELVNGPFRRLSGRWTFLALGEDGCKVSLQMSFEMDNRLMGAALGKVFGLAADKMVDAFCERAEVLYGAA